MNASRVISGVAALSGWALMPALASACERCFGSGADSVIVEAISSSMFGLLVMTVVVFTGVVSFFRKIAGNEVALEDGQCRPPQTESPNSLSDHSPS